MKTVHTHKGHCQACGRIQAVDNDTAQIAKHGYNVKHGYFVGICQGSQFSPLERSRAKLDDFRHACLNTAKFCDGEVLEYQAGTKRPATVLKYNGTHEYAQVVTVKGHGSRGQTVWNAVELQWAEGNEFEQKKAVAAKISEYQRKAEFMRSHEKFLRELAQRIHGQPLLPVEVKRELKVGDKVKNLAWGLDGHKVEAIDYRTGNYGRREKVARITRNGKLLWVPVRSLRNFWTVT